MLLKREGEDDVILYDDHGEAWRIRLAHVAGGTGFDERVTPGASEPPTIEFVGSDGEPLSVQYAGAATCEEELLFDEVVVHFLKAQD